MAMRNLFPNMEGLALAKCNGFMVANFTLWHPSLSSTATMFCVLFLPSILFVKRNCLAAVRAYTCIYGTVHCVHTCMSVCMAGSVCVVYAYTVCVCLVSLLVGLYVCTCLGLCLCVSGWLAVYTHACVSVCWCVCLCVWLAGCPLQWPV